MAATAFELNGIVYSNLDYTATGTITAGDMVMVGDVIGVATEDAVSGDATTCITAADWIELPSATVSASTWVVGTPIYFDRENARVTIEPAGGANRKVGAIKVTGADDDTTIQVDFNGLGMGGNSSALSIAYEELTLTQLNAGTVLLPEVEGRTYIVHKVRIEFAGVAATATSINVSDTAGTPVDVLTVAVAAAGDGKMVSSEVTIANVTIGSISTALTADKGVQIRVVGSALTGTTAAKVLLDYTYTD